MSDNDKIITPSKYPSNSNTEKKTKKEDNKPKIKPKVEPMVTGKVTKKKKTLGDKFRDTFVVSDSKEVSKYVFMDVVVPTIKELLMDIINKGGNMLIFGDTRTVSRNPNRRTGHTSYSRLSNFSYERPGSSPRRNLDYQTRATHDFDNLLYEHRFEAERVLDRLVDLTQLYGEATVEDLYDASNITSDYTDRKWGWHELGTAKVRSVVVDGDVQWVILLPKPVLLKGD